MADAMLATSFISMADAMLATSFILIADAMLATLFISIADVEVDQGNIVVPRQANYVMWCLIGFSYKCGRK